MFRQDFTCPALLEDPAVPYPYGAITHYGGPFQILPVQNDKAIGLVPVRSPLLGESQLISFPPANEMFQFAGFASLGSCIHQTMTQKGRDSPFGHPRIKACCQLPEAFRRLPRPSSPPAA